MNTLSRVVWSEGMHLGPHHFQVQNRYFESLVEFTASTLAFRPWGFASLQMDEEALRNGTLRLTHAKGIFPDGLVFLIPEADSASSEREIAEVFPPMADSVTFFLAISPYVPGGANCSIENGDDDSRRYHAASVEMADELTGLDTKTIRMARKNFRLLAESELDGEQALPVARLRRSAAGQFVIDPRFVPPLLRIQASQPLMVMLRRLVEMLEEKARSVVKPRDLSAGTAGGFSAAGISNAWFLHCVNSALAPLRHLLESSQAHPEELYRQMARLGGGLCTFGIESHPSALPLYDHQKLGECFDELDRHIRMHLELVVPSNCIRISLAKTANYFWEGVVADTRTFVHSRWIIALRAKIGESELISGTPRLVKICSREFLPKLVARALPGLTLKHLPAPPPAVSPRVDFQYFGIDKAGPCWDHMVATRQVAVYVPGEIPEPDIELMVVLES